MGDDNKVEIKMDIVGDLDLEIFVDRFQVLMNKEAFNYQLVNCLVYLFSKHTCGYFRMMHLDYVLSKHMRNLMHSKDSIDYFLPYSLEALSALGFVRAKEINGKQFLITMVNQYDFNDAHRFLSKYCKGVSVILDNSVEVFKEILKREDKRDGYQNKSS